MKVICSHCGQGHEFSADFVGKKVKCTSCSNDFIVENPNLIPCPDCFASVSRRASVCPHCGAPLNTSFMPGSDSVQTNNAPEKNILVCHPAAIYYLLNIIVGILLLPILVGIVILIVVIINIKCTTYQITSQRVLVKTGWLNKKQTEIWIKDMRGVNLQQSFWERIIGTGSVSIGTAATAGAEIQMRGLSRAQKIVDTINSLRKQ